jgi:hypothetical protein
LANMDYCKYLPKVLESLFPIKATVEVHHPIMVLMILRGRFQLSI